MITTARSANHPAAAGLLLKKSRWTADGGFAWPTGYADPNRQAPAGGRANPMDARPPVRPRRPLLQFYGFRKKRGRWVCTAYQGEERVYERAGAP
jgi:hypothetical protein